jgi:hypothetical protein
LLNGLEATVILSEARDLNTENAPMKTIVEVLRLSSSDKLTMTVGRCANRIVMNS